MRTVLDIISGIVYIIVSLIILLVVGMFYLGFVLVDASTSFVKYINNKIQ